MSNGLSYKRNISDFFDYTSNYFDAYNDLYVDFYNTFGPDITYMVISPTYRVIKDYDVYITQTETPAFSIQFFGAYSGNSNLNTFTRGIKAALSNSIMTYDMINMIFTDKVRIRTDIRNTTEIKLKQTLINICNTKIDSIIGKNSLISFENIRNQLIKSLDGLNFLTKYNFDAKRDDNKFYSANLSGTTDFYSSYEPCINYISGNTAMMYSELNSAIDFNNPVINENTLSNILSFLIKDKVSEIMTIFSDTTLYNTNLQNTLKRNITTYTKIEKIEKIKFTKKPIFNTSLSLEYLVVNTVEVTNTNVIMEINKLHKTSNNVDNKLNYYR